MKRFPLLAILGALAASWSPAIAACVPYGTQLDCVIAGRHVVVGTQTDETSSLPLSWLQGGLSLPDARSSSTPQVDVYFQDFGRDPSTCRRYGDETYCY